MLTGELRNQIDGIWNDFWSGGLANPLQVIEQITYLIFIKRLDEMQELEERKATTLGSPIERRIFPEGADERGEPYANLRWSRFKHFAGPEMFRIVDEHVFPFIRALNGEGTSYARHMRDARFQIPGPALLAKVVDKLDKLDMGDRDTKGDVYEYMLAKIATAGQNGQFRTPRHIIATMVELMRPARAASWWRLASTCAGTIPASSATTGCAGTSTRACSTASTSTRPCCASA